VLLDTFATGGNLVPKTMSVHDLTLAAWWSDAQVYSEYFFSTTASLRFDQPDPDLMAGYHELQMIRRSFEQADFPPRATFARQHLLNSMSKIMSGLRLLTGNAEAAPP
jgi:hypothetical protein